MTSLCIGTSGGLHTLDETGRCGEVQAPGRRVTALGGDGDALWAVLDGTEVWHVAGGAWTEVADIGRLEARCVAGIGGEVFIGTSEAHLLRLNGGSVERVESFDAIADRDDWHTPWGGPPDTRSMSEWDEDTYVNVHVGGIAHTGDGGASWTPTIDIDADVHQVATAEGRVLAACAGGLATSLDRGQTWSFRTEGLEAVYARAVAVCGDTVLVSTSNGPRGGRAAVYRGGLAGGPFERCAAGPGWFDRNIDTSCLDAVPDGSFAAFGTSDGHVFVSTDQGASWDELASDLGAVTPRPADAVTMEVVRYRDPEAFRRDAAPLLMADAPRNNLPLAILQTLTDQPAAYPVFHLWLATREGAPLGLALQTEPHHVVLAEPLDPGAIRALAEAVVADGAPLPGVTANLPWTDRFAADVASITGHRVERVLNEGVWELTQVADVPVPSGRMRPATAGDRDLLLAWIDAFTDEALPPGRPRDDARIALQVDARIAGEGGGYRLWDDGEPVAMSGHQDVPAVGSRIGPVYTPPGHRRHGYATRLVAEHSAWLLARGDRACFLFTDMANPTSNAIYARIGYVMLGEAAENAFRPPGANAPAGILDR